MLIIRTTLEYPLTENCKLSEWILIVFVYIINLLVGVDQPYLSCTLFPGFLGYELGVVPVCGLDIGKHNIVRLLVSMDHFDVFSLSSLEAAVVWSISFYSG